MRDVDRIKPFLAKIEEYWLKNQDLRFGQIVMNIIQPEISNSQVYYIEDEAFLEKLKDFQKVKKS